MKSCCGQGFQISIQSMASHLRIDSGSSIYEKYSSYICSYHSLCSWSKCERSPVSQNFITVLSLRLITQKILIFLTSAITKREAWRAKQMSKTREFQDVGRQVHVHVAANHVSALLAAFIQMLCSTSQLCRLERKSGTKCSVGQVIWGYVFLRSFRVHFIVPWTPSTVNSFKKSEKYMFSISQLFWKNACT